MNVQTRSTDDMGKLKTLWYRYRYLAGYLILFGFVMFAIVRVQAIGQESRNNLASSAKIVVNEGCKRDNDTRAAVRKIIRRGARELPRYLEEGLINKAQYDRAVKANEHALKLLAPVNCSESAGVISED